MIVIFRFHSDTQIYQRPMYTVNEEAETSRPNTRNRQDITTPGIVTSLQQDVREEEKTSEEKKQKSTLCLPHIVESEKNSKDRYSYNSYCPTFMSVSNILKPPPTGNPPPATHYLVLTGPRALHRLLKYNSEYTISPCRKRVFCQVQLVHLATQGVHM